MKNIKLPTTGAGLSAGWRMSCFPKAKEEYSMCREKQLGTAGKKGRMLLPSNFNCHFIILKILLFLFLDDLLKQIFLSNSPLLCAE